MFGILTTLCAENYEWHNHIQGIKRALYVVLALSRKISLRKLACLRVMAVVKCVNQSCMGGKWAHTIFWQGQCMAQWHTAHITLQQLRMPQFFSSSTEMLAIKMKQNGFRCFPMCVCGGGSARMINYFHQICVHVPSPFAVGTVRKSVHRQRIHNDPSYFMCH